MTLTITYQDNITRTFEEIQGISECEAPKGKCLLLNPYHPKKEEIMLDCKDIKKVEVVP